MDEKYVNKIPLKLRKIIVEEKSKEYSKEIIADKPLEEQNLTKETLAILAVLNYNYWCENEEIKKELLDKYKENEEIYQKELREKYNPDNIFKNKSKVIIEENKEAKDIAIVSEVPRYKKILDLIKNMFKKS